MAKQHSKREAKGFTKLKKCKLSYLIFESQPTNGWKEDSNKTINRRAKKISKNIPITVGCHSLQIASPRRFPSSFCKVSFDNFTISSPSSRAKFLAKSAYFPPLKVLNQSCTSSQVQPSFGWICRCKTPCLFSSSESFSWSINFLISSGDSSVVFEVMEVVGVFGASVLCFAVGGFFLFDSNF